MEPAATTDDSERACWRAARLVAGLVILFHICLFAAVPYSRQDFPLSDDWAYSLGAFSFQRGDGIRYDEWSATPLLGQWVWSAPFVFVLGETHQALRVSTASLHVMLGAVLAWLLTKAKIRFAASIAVVVAFHPLMCLASATFLTDVPTLAFSLLAVAFWTFAPGSLGAVVGFVFAVAAAANRQTAVALPAAYLVASWFGVVPNRRWIAPSISLVIGVAVAVWFRFRSDAIGYPLRIPALEGTLDAALNALYFCGLGLAPIALLLAPRDRLRYSLPIAFAAWCAWAYATSGFKRVPDAAFPFPDNVGNLFTAQGPFGDSFTIGSRPALLGPIALSATTAVAIIGAGGLLAALQTSTRSAWANPVVLFGLAHLLLPVVSILQFDRYYLPVLVGVAFLLPREASPTPRRSWWLIPVAAWVLLSFILCRDWLTVNAAKWELGRRAVASGIAVEEIEGGLEWDFHHAWKDGRPPRGRFPPRQGFAVPFSLERLPHLTGRYALSLGDDPRFQAIDRIPYQRWLPQRREEVVLLKAW